jgi:hypothetical protein
MNDDAWSKDIAVLIADSLVDGRVIDRGSVARAGEIIAEEIWARLLVGDYPPGATDPGARPGGKPKGSGQFSG